MFFSSLITPVILIVLYGTFLSNVYKDSFQSSLPEFLSVSDKLINGTVAAQLAAELRYRYLLCQSDHDPG